MQTNDRPISELMKDIHTGKAQLPDFQRGWVWDDNRIRALIASITSNFPIGAAMFLEYGNENIRFKYRVIEGAPAKDAKKMWGDRFEVLVTSHVNGQHLHNH